MNSFFIFFFISFSRFFFSIFFSFFVKSSLYFFIYINWCFSFINSLLALSWCKQVFIFMQTFRIKSFIFDSLCRCLNAVTLMFKYKFRNGTCVFVFNTFIKVTEYTSTTIYKQLFWILINSLIDFFNCQLLFVAAPLAFKYKYQAAALCIIIDWIITL